MRFIDWSQKYLKKIIIINKTSSKVLLNIQRSPPFNAEFTKLIVVPLVSSLALSWLVEYRFSQRNNFIPKLSPCEQRILKEIILRLHRQRTVPVERNFSQKHNYKDIETNWMSNQLEVFSAWIPGLHVNKERSFDFVLHGFRVFYVVLWFYRPSLYYCYFEQKIVFS